MFLPFYNILFSQKTLLLFIQFPLASVLRDRLQILFLIYSEIKRRVSRSQTRCNRVVFL